MTTLVGGRYRLDQRIATGGMGEVWRATDSVLGREVAVKLLKAEFADDATSRTRFEAEARNAAQLHHPGIASVFDFGEQTLESGDTTAYLVMELVDGKPLSALLRPNEPLAYAATAKIVADAADAVQVAHDAGIVHRDIKPANLLVTPAGAVKVTDFGIARAGDGVPLTRTGEVIGTAYYLAPEQAEGREATPASDVYALGVVLYECLAGRRPFDATAPVAVALAHVREQPRPLPGEVPPGLAAVCMQAMSKDPGERPASAADFAVAVRGWEDAATRTLPASAAGAAGAAAAAAAAAGAAGAGVAGADEGGPDEDAGGAEDGAQSGAESGAEGGGPSTAAMAQADEEGANRRARPAWLLPVLGVLAVLLVVGGVFGVMSLLDDDGGGTPNPAPTPDTTGTSTDEPGPTQETGDPQPTQDTGDPQPTQDTGDPQPTQDTGDPQPTRTEPPSPTQTPTQNPTPTQPPTATEPNETTEEETTAEESPTEEPPTDESPPGETLPDGGPEGGSTTDEGETTAGP